MMGGRRDTERQGEQIKEHCPFFPQLLQDLEGIDMTMLPHKNVHCLCFIMQVKQNMAQSRITQIEQVCTEPSSLSVTVGTPGYMTAAGCSPETRRAGGRECEAVDNGQSPLRVYSQIPLSAALQEHPVQTDPLLSLGSSFKTCSTAPL